MSDRYLVRFADYEDDRTAIAQGLLKLAEATGLDVREVRTTGHGFSLPRAWAEEHLSDVVLADLVDDDEAPAADGELFNPDEHTVADVVKHLESADFDEQVRVISAEAGGQNRATIARWRQRTEAAPSPDAADATAANTSSDAGDAAAE